MKQFVSSRQQTHDVEVEGTRVTVDGVGLETDLAPVSGTPLYHLLLAGASWTVAAEPLEGPGGGRWGWWASEWRSRCRTNAAAGSRRRAARASGRAAEARYARRCPAWWCGSRWRKGSGWMREPVSWSSRR